MKIFFLLFGKIIDLILLLNVWIDYFLENYVMIIFFYDLMIVKVIVYGEICEEVILKLYDVLEELKVEGIKMNMLMLL